MHSAATLNDDKSYARFWWGGSCSSFEPPINLDYQQAVETLLAHGADLSAQDNEVNTLTARCLACTTPMIQPCGLWRSMMNS